MASATQYSTKIFPSKLCFDVGNHITSFEFNPTGELISTIDSCGICLISDVNTNNDSFHVNLEVNRMSGISNFLYILLFNLLDNWALCRWSTNTGESHLYIKSEVSKLNVFDVEKKTLTLTAPIELEQSPDSIFSYSLPLIFPASSNLFLT